MDKRLEIFKILIQTAIIDQPFTDISKVVITTDDWLWLYNESMKQAIAGFVWRGVEILIEEDMIEIEQYPPSKLDMHWQETRNSIMSANGMIEWAACILTEITDGEGFKSAVLKGQSKAMCYPDPSLRTPGDLDFWVENGRAFSEMLIKDFGVEGTFSYHHFHTTASFMHFPRVPLEIHYRPSSGSFNPFKNNKIQAFLEARVQKIIPITTSHGHFYIPDHLYNMVSELVHIRRHFVGGGIGLRHMIDFYYLSGLCSPEHHKELMQDLGLWKFWLVVAYVISEFVSPRPLQLAKKPNEKAGKVMLDEILRGGNFGRYAPRQQHGFFVRYFLHVKRSMKLFWIAPSEFFWCEVMLHWRFLQTVPERIRKRKLSLRDERK